MSFSSIDDNPQSAGVASRAPPGEVRGKRTRGTSSLVFDLPEKLPNLGFEDGFLYWVCDFEKPGTLSLGINREGGGIRIIGHGGSWELRYKPLLRASGMEHYVLEAKVKCNFVDRRFTFSGAGSAFASINVMALDEDLNPIRVRFSRWTFGDPGEPFLREDLGIWSCGNISFCGSLGWRHLYSFFKPPRGTKYLSLSVRGGGRGEVYIKGLRLSRRIPNGVRLNVRPTPFKSVPQALLYKRIPLGDYAGKFLRIGDLNGDGRPEFVFAQNERIGPGDIYKHITCITAVDLEGNILWQRGRPDLRNYEVTSDLPVGVMDLNGDGKDEVICCMNFEILVLDGITGEIVRRKPTPKSREGGGYCEGPETLFERITGDCIVFCNLRGQGEGRDFILKDRYNNLWAYTADLDELWSYSGKLIHSPLVYDFDGDGRDEVFTGDALLDDSGRVLWTIDLYDHCDSAVVYEHRGMLILALAHQNGGFYFLDALRGEVLKEHHLGHAQVLSLGRFDPSVNERLICAQTYWGGLNQFLFDLDGNLIHASFEKVFGWVPVNWIGDGTELLASPRGLYDCYGNLLIEFPDSYTRSKWGAKVFVWDVGNDPRDEVLVWDEYYLTIYTQAERAKGEVYRPKRRLYNQTFYGNGNFVSL